ncbi:MAG: hypothetical protein ACI4JV_00050 [Ruminiclostridium sp.]
MTTIDQLSLIIQGLLVAGVALRVIILLIKIVLNPDDKPQLIPKIRNTLVFMVFGIIIFQIKDLIVRYYS